MVNDLHTSQTQPLRLAFLGGGQNSAVGYTHYLAARMDGFFEVVAGCFSRDAEVNRQTGRGFAIPEARIYQSIDALLSKESGQVDAVCVCSLLHRTTLKPLLSAFKQGST